MHGSTAAIVNDQTWSAAMSSGGSLASWSLTPAAAIVTVHVSLTGRFAVGLSVNVVGPPLASAATGPPAAHVIVNHVPLTLTGSENVRVMFASTATSVAPAPGSSTRRTARLPGRTALFGAPGVFSASPATSVPVKPGMPARSKSLRTQSSAVSVSTPSGMRDAPPGANG